MFDKAKAFEDLEACQELDAEAVEQVSGGAVPIMLAALWMTSSIFGYNIGRDLANR